MSEHGSTASGSRFVRSCCVFFLAALFGFWISSVAGKYFTARLQNHSFPLSLNSIMLKQGDYHFTDFTDFDPISERVIARGENYDRHDLVIVYPAPMMCVYILFYRLFPDPLSAYLIFVSVCAAAAAAYLMVALSTSAANRWVLAGVAGISAALSFPMMFLLERANLEGFVWPLVALGLAAFVARHHKIAAILFALAASMKLYPGLLLLLLLARKRYKEFGFAVLAFAFFTLAGLQVLGPSIPAAIQEVRAGLGALSGSHVMSFRYDEIGYDHSLFSVVKEVLYLPHRHDENDVILNGQIRAAGTPYLLFALTTFAVLYWTRIRKLPLLNQSMALIILAVTLPFMSEEYTLTHVYFAWALFLLFLARDVTTGRESIPWQAAWTLLACFAFVFAPGPFGHFAGQLKTGALLVALFVALAVPMRSSLLEEPA